MRNVTRIFNSVMWQVYNDTHMMLNGRSRATVEVMTHWRGTNEHFVWLVVKDILQFGNRI